MYYIYIHCIYIYYSLVLWLVTGMVALLTGRSHPESHGWFFASNVHAVVYIHVCKSAILLGYISHERLYIILL